MSILQEPSNSFGALLLSGWRIEPTACACGGRYAWFKPKPEGGYEGMGCICHTDPYRLVKGIDHSLLINTLKTILEPSEAEKNAPASDPDGYWIELL